MSSCDESDPDWVCGASDDDEDDGTCDGSDSMLENDSPPATPPKRRSVCFALAATKSEDEDDADCESLGSCDTPFSEREDEGEEDGDEEDEDFVSETEDLSRDAVEHVIKTLRRRRLPSLPLP